MLAGEVVVDGEVVTRLGTKVDPRTAVIRVDGQAAAAGLAARLPRAQQAPRRRLDDVRPRGPPHPVGPGRRPARAALPRRAARHRHLRADHAHQRRRLRAAAGAPVVRGGQDLRRRGRPARSPRPTLRKLLDGVTLDDGPVTVSRTRIVQHGTGKTIVELVIHEGRNRIVRRLLEHVGHPVTRLTRTRIGPVRLGQLKSGELRDLTLDELGVLLDTHRALTPR